MALAFWAQPCRAGYKNMELLITSYSILPAENCYWIIISLATGRNQREVAGKRNPITDGHRWTERQGRGCGRAHVMKIHSKV